RVRKDGPRARGPEEAGPVPGRRAGRAGPGAGDRRPLRHAARHDRPRAPPVLRSPTCVGGYFDVQFRDAENAHHEFSLERIVPFFAADIHDRVKFATEIEIEDGHEVEVELGTLDLILWKGRNL